MHRKWTRERSNTNGKKNTKRDYRLCELFFSDRYGLDLYEGKVKDNKEAGVLEPTMSKVKCLKFATEAAITILRIDDLIKLAPEQRDEEMDY